MELMNTVLVFSLSKKCGNLSSPEEEHQELYHNNGLLGMDSC